MLSGLIGRNVRGRARRTLESRQLVADGGELGLECCGRVGESFLFVAEALAELLWALHA